MRAGTFFSHARWRESEERMAVIEIISELIGTVSFSALIELSGLFIRETLVNVFISISYVVFISLVDSSRYSTDRHHLSVDFSARKWQWGNLVRSHLQFAWSPCCLSTLDETSWRKSIVLSSVIFLSSSPTSAQRGSIGFLRWCSLRAPPSSSSSLINCIFVCIERQRFPFRSVHADWLAVFCQ